MYPTVHKRICPEILFFSCLDTYATFFSLVNGMVFLLFSSHVAFFLSSNTYVYALTRSTAETKMYPTVHKRICPEILFFSCLDTYATFFSLVNGMVFLLFSSHVAFFLSSNTIRHIYVQGFVRYIQRTHCACCHILCSCC